LNARLALCEALLAELVPERGRHREQANGEQSSGCASTVTQTATSRLKPLAVHTGLLLLGGPTADGAGHGLLTETGPRPHAADDEVKPPEQESTKPQQAQEEERAGVLDEPTAKLQVGDHEDTRGSGNNNELGSTLEAMLSEAKQLLSYCTEKGDTQSMEDMANLIAQLEHSPLKDDD
jgi:hypothetical protein